LAEIIAHNAKDSTYKMGVNQFTDMTDSERKALLGYKRMPAQRSNFQAPSSTVAPPESVDWRTKGAVSPVKDQGGCGSCWAFATVETVESALQIATGKLLTLSPQNVVSCTPNPDHCGGTGGCNGATAELGFQYIADKGVSDEATWPYRQVTGTCTEKAKVAKVKGFVKLAENEQDPLVNAVATVGPIAISVAADAWFSYRSGIFDGCGVNADIDHAVQLVGYGTEKGTDYWIVRNSWGASWGEKGYIRIKKFGSSKDHCGIDKTPADGSGCTGGPSQVTVCGMCGILYDSSYPVGANFTAL
jgi:cathepsin L